MDDNSVNKRLAELEKVRRHVRILVDLGRAAGETADLNRFSRSGGGAGRAGSGDRSC
jgi:hypothetical protein